MATKRISALKMSLEELEYVLDIPQGHHIEYVQYDAQYRTCRIFISGDSMHETYPSEAVREIRYSTLLQRFRGKKKKHTETPIGR